MRTIEGLEIYSDNEENLYVPIAARRKKRTTKKRTRDDGSEDGEEGRSMYKDDSDFKASGESESEDSGGDSGPERPTVFKHSLRCLKCNEGFALVFGLVNHMRERHDEPEYNPEDENYINMPEVKSPKNFCQKIHWQILPTPTTFIAAPLTSLMTCIPLTSFPQVLRHKLVKLGFECMMCSKYCS